MHSICHMCVYNHVNTYAPLLNKKSEFPPHHLSLVFALHQFHRTMAPWQGDAKSAQFAKRVNTGKLSTVPCTYNRTDLASPFDIAICLQSLLQFMSFRGHAPTRHPTCRACCRFRKGAKTSHSSALLSQS